MARSRATIATLFFSLVCNVAWSQPAVSGNSVLRRRVGDAEIRIETTTRLAGAIHSVQWRGKEFINSTDHGRQLQSACSFDVGQAGFHAECFNPTEAGGRRDGAGKRSTSRLLELSTLGGELKTRTQMAFWLHPGERSAGRLAKNQTALSRHTLSKRVRIGVPGMPQVLDYRVTFTVPKGERHRYAQFEALTGYMPSDFRVFLRFEPATGKLKPLSDGPGEQKDPVVLSTADGRFAMGVFSPQQPSKGYQHAGYGRFRFTSQKVVKWNCVFRVRSADQVAAGDYSYRLFVPIGTREDVRRDLVKLHQKHAK